MDLVRHYAVMVGSYCANVTMVLSLCHLCLLPAVHSDTSGILPALFLTRNSGDYSHSLALSLSHAHTHTNRNTDETLATSTDRDIHIIMLDDRWSIHYYVITDTTTTTTTVLCYLKSLTPITYLLESLLYSATDIFMTSIST